MDEIRERRRKPPWLRILGSPLLTLVLLLGLLLKELAPLFRLDNVSARHQDHMAFAPEYRNQSRYVVVNNHNNTTSTNNIPYVSKSSSPSSLLKLQQQQSSTSATTKIIGFTDQMFQEIAWTWYQELNDLGHTEHWVATHDSSSAQYLHQKGVERVVGLLDQNNFSIRHCPGFGDLAKKKQIQTYRRSLFAGRWKYLLSELLLGHNIMMTDVDNIFTAKIPMDELEQSEYDVFYAFAGTIKSFPKYWFNQRGFTVCGGLNWWRAVPSVIEFVTQVVERCNCDMKVVEDCNCMCDDQVVLNNLIFKGDYAILWNQTFQVPKTPQDLIWNETLSGVCNQTGHKVQVWERHRAYRGNLPGDRKDCPVHNWVAMPFVKNKTLMRHKWHNVCGLETVF